MVVALGEAADVLLEQATKPRTRGVSRTIMPVKGQQIYIAGLSAIRPPVSDSGKVPGLLTNEEVAEIVRFPGPRQNEENYGSQLMQIQNWCQWLTDHGQNKKLVGLEDFNIAIIATTHDPVPAKPTDGTAEPNDPNAGDIFVDAGVALVVKHKETGRAQDFDLDPPKGFNADNYYRTTALGLVALGEPVPETLEG